MTESLREIARRVALESRRAQGLPDHVEDPSVLALAVQFIQDASVKVGVGEAGAPPAVPVPAGAAAPAGGLPGALATPSQSRRSA